MVAPGEGGNKMNSTFQLTDSLLAVAVSESSGVALLGQHLLAAIVFSIVGIIVFAACLFALEKITPYSIVNEIVEEHNVAMSVVVGALVLGVSIIIGAAILG